MNAVAKRLVIRGRVQGVGYRDAVVQAAIEQGVAGWVRNRHDGSVEIFVQGVPESIEGFIEWCRRGPPLARVVAVDVSPAEIDAGLTRFAFRPSG